MRKFINRLKKTKTTFMSVSSLLETKNNIEASIKSAFSSLISIFKKNDDDLLEKELEKFKKRCSELESENENLKLDIISHEKHIKDLYKCL
jgi:sugar-specific transcriptional regulator TrmB